MRSLRLPALASLPLLVALIGATPRTRSPEPTTIVQVHNANWSAITVYLVRSGVPWRLGTVVTGRTERFRVPADFEHSSGRVQLLIDPLGSSRTYSTEPVVFDPGETIRLDVQNELAFTSLTVGR